MVKGKKTPDKSKISAKSKVSNDSKNKGVKNSGLKIKEKQKSEDILELSRDLELEEMIEGVEEDNEGEFQISDSFSEVSLNFPEAKAPVLEKVAEVRDSAAIPGVFVPRQERESEENIDYDSGRKVEYGPAERAGNAAGQMQFQYDEGSLIDYDAITRQNEEQRQARRIMENVGEMATDQLRGNRWRTSEKAPLTDTRETERSRKYLSRGDYKEGKER